MEQNRIDAHSVTEARRIIARREADVHLRRALRSIYDGRLPDPVDRVILINGLMEAMKTPEGRKALGMSAKARGPAPKYDPAKYEHGDPAVDVAMRFSQGQLSRVQARQELAEHTDAGNIKTLDRVLDEFCNYFGFRVPG